MHTTKLPLKTGKRKDIFLDQLFTVEDKIQNIVVSEYKKRLRQLKRDKQYRSLKKQYAYAITHSQKERSKAIGEEMNAIREKYGLTEASLKKYVSKAQKTYRDLISSHQAQGIASRVYSGVEKVLFGNGNDIHFKKRDELHTIASKSFNGIRYYDPYHTGYYKKSVHPKYNAEIEIDGVQIEVVIPEDDEYIYESLQHPVKYVQIERKMFPSGWKYYAILYLEGDAPKKITKGKGTSGIDPGVSSLAMAGEEGVLLEVIAPRVQEYNDRIAKVQRRMDKSKKLSNPGNYNSNGTIKKGSKTWVYSKSYLKDKRLLKTLYRKKSEYIQMCEFIIANKVIQKS